MVRVSSGQRRRDLIGAARAVLLAEGPAAVTVRRVAAEAGAPVASVHYAFRDKSELLQAVTDELLEQFERALRARVEVGQGLRGTLAGLLAGYWAWVSSEPGLARAVVATALAGAPGTALATSAPASGGPATRPHAIDAGRRLVLDALRTAGEEPTRVDLDDLAHLVLVAIDGLTVVYLLDGDSARAERSIDQLVDALSTLC